MGPGEPGMSERGNGGVMRVFRRKEEESEQ